MNKAQKSKAPVVFEEVIYPESDGEPMAETDIHRNYMIDVIKILEDFYRDDPRVYVSGNLFMYYVPGDTRKKVAPDVLVVKEVEKRLRRTYQIWKEGKAPDLVIEVTSEDTRWEDMDFKRKLYHRLGVKEYYLYDPTGDYLKDQLLGYRLVGTRYVPVRLPKGEDRLHSDVLNLDLVLESGQLRLYDPQQKQFLLTPDENAQARRQAETEREQEAHARRQAETEREQEAQARRQAEAALRQAEEETARLRAELERMQKQLRPTASGKPSRWRRKS
jgi:Uma2 family endonuclease